MISGGVWGYERLDRDYKSRGNERHVPEVYAALGLPFVPPELRETGEELATPKRAFVTSSRSM